MLKKLLLGTVLLTTSLFSQAGIISIIDGADMAGMEVTAYFAGGGSETKTWAALTSDSGGAVASDWSLSLTGETFGDITPGGVLKGVWYFNNSGVAGGINKLEINGGIAGIYFDDLDSVEHTAGSSFGRPFATANTNNVLASFTNPLSAPDLFGTLTIDWLGGTSLEAGQEFSFLTDTDKATVSEPVTALVFFSGLLALVSTRRNKA